MPEVSVIIPCYNRGEWLGEAVGSVLAQTFQDFELIVVDDGSTEEIRPHLGPPDRRVRYIRQENQGPSAARNRGIDLAGGRYIAFLDADDLFLPEKLAVQVALMDAHPEVLLSHTSYERVDAAGNPIGIIPSGEWLNGRVYPDIYRECTIATPTVMIRREALGADLRFLDSVKIAEDIILWTQLARRAPILGIAQVLTRVRMHGSSTTLDPISQITGSRNIIAHGLAPDRSIPAARRRALVAAMHEDMAGFYLVPWEREWGLKFCFRLLWAMNCRAVKRAFRKGLGFLTTGGRAGV